MRDIQQTKTCEKCGHAITYFEKTWHQMEWANGKHFPAKHRGCGGKFKATSVRIAMVGR